MIKFFRKIRQKMLTDSKFGKYLLYAIGEIVLVVIGILIALQINIANENRKTEKIRQNYYSQILVDLEKETENINERILKLDSSIVSSNAYWSYIETPGLKPAQIMTELLKVETDFRYLAFNTNTIETLESTGDIKLMSEKIRNRLIELKRSQDQLSRVAKGNYEVYLASHEKLLHTGMVRLKFRIPTVEELEIEKNYTNIILMFEGGIALKAFTDKNIRNTLAKMLIDIEEINELVNTNLEKK